GLQVANIPLGEFWLKPLLQPPVHIRSWLWIAAFKLQKETTNKITHETREPSLNRNTMCKFQCWNYTCGHPLRNDCWLCEGNSVCDRHEAPNEYPKVEGVCPKCKEELDSRLIENKGSASESLSKEMDAGKRVPEGSV